jgi:hypothetical protein
VFAEIAMKNSPHPFYILNMNRNIEPQRPFQVGAGHLTAPGRTGLSDHKVYDVAWNGPQQKEDGQSDQQESRYH